LFINQPFKENEMKSQLLIVVLLGLALGAAGAWGDASDITGTWIISVTLESGSPTGPMVFDFKQEGEKLTGVQTDRAGEPKVTGTVKGKKVAFIVEGKNKRGEPYKSAWTGTIESPTRMSGAAEFVKGPGKWTAVKKAKKG
jgi:hypothetical protein